MDRQKDDGAFCRAYLRTMDPEQAAAEMGRKDGFALLGRKSIQEKLEKMRTDAAGQLRREDVIRRLAQLAFGRVNDAVKLALYKEAIDPDQLDLSAVTEIKVTDKGVEIKLADRIQALEQLAVMAAEGPSGAEAFLQSLQGGSK